MNTDRYTGHNIMDTYSDSNVRIRHYIPHWDGVRGKGSLRRLRHGEVI